MRRALFVAVVAIAAGSVMCSSFSAAPGAPSAAPTEAGGLDSALEAAVPVADAPSLGEQRCPATAPTDSLVGYYPFNEAGGQSVPDCSVLHQDGVVDGSAAQWTTGRNGGGLRLSSTAGCVDLGKDPALGFTGPFTVTAWVDVASFPADPAVTGYIAGKTLDPDLAGWRIAVASGHVDAAIALPSMERLVVSVPITTNRFSHVALTVMPGGNMTLRVDGVASTVGGVPSPLLPDDASVARIGCNSNGTQQLDGVVDDVHFYTRVLTEAELDDLRR